MDAAFPIQIQIYLSIYYAERTSPTLFYAESTTWKGGSYEPNELPLDPPLLLQQIELDLASCHVCMIRPQFTQQLNHSLLNVNIH